MKKIIIVGEAGCGKTFLAEEFERHGYKANLSVTTRPMRDGEKHMSSYNFMSKWRFFWNRLFGMFWEFKKFNGWYYGTLHTEWIRKDLFIFTPGSVESMSEKDLANSSVWHIYVDENVRRERLSKRSDADSVDRRIEADRIDFDIHDKYKNNGTMAYSPNGDFDAKDFMIEILTAAGEDPEVINAIK